MEKREKKDDVFRFIGEFLAVFGFTTAFLSILSIFIGESAKEYSTIFALGKQGLTLETLLQFFLTSVLITILRFILFTDGLICRISLAIRTFLMFFFVVLLIALFAWKFGWFPVDMLEAWAGFFVSFAICSFISAYVMAAKTDRENKKMEEALQKMKEAEVEKTEKE